MTQFRLKDVGTRFALPIICPKTGEEVSAEQLFNRCCDALGYVVCDHIGDLILDNLQYPASEHREGEYRYTTAYDEQILCDAVYAWAADVHKQIDNSLMPRA